MSSDTTVQGASPPEGFFEALQERAMSPGWAKRQPAMWAEPRPAYVPVVWRYADALKALTEASAFVSTEFAERRNLILVNPVPGNIYPTCRNLVAAYQLVLPGETARSHRHSPNALRLVMDVQSGAYTLVNGMRIDMEPDDVVLTPQWHWHGHANYSNGPAFWIDFLDVPLVQNLDNMFFEHHPEALQAVQGSAPDSTLRYRGGELERRARADGMIAIGDGQLKTIGLQVIGLSQGQRQDLPGQITNSIFAVTSGELVADVEKLGRVELSRGDVMVVPSWFAYSLEGAGRGVTVLRVSDEPVFASLGFGDVRRDAALGGSSS